METHVATTFRAVYPSAYESVAKARQAVGAFAQLCGYAGPEISDIMLAVGEACNNAVEHGHVELGEFVVTASFARNMLRTEISDNGRGFREPAVSMVVDPGDCIGRGRGIPIMRALMDDVTYRCSPAGTIAMLEKRLLTRGLEEAGSELRGLDAGRRR